MGHGHQSGGAPLEFRGGHCCLCGTGLDGVWIIHTQVRQSAVTAGRIAIATDVAPLPDGPYTCQSDDYVPITVEL